MKLRGLMMVGCFVAGIAAVVTLAEQPEQKPDRQGQMAPAKVTGYAAVNGLNMYYEITGQGEPAVYVHPLVSHVGLVRQLTSNRKWIAPDLQGHGRTADIHRPMTVEQHADDIAALLKHLKIEHADIFGDSFGGAIAITMAVRHPEQVRRVVLYGNPILPLPNELADAIPADSDLLKWDREEYQKVAPDPKHWAVTYAKSMQSGVEWKGISIDELKAIKAPVLIACGDHDLVPIERCVELSRTIPNGQLAVIPDASHFVLFSEPEKLLPTIAAFFDAPLTKEPLSTFQTGYYPGKSR